MRGRAREQRLHRLLQEGNPCLGCGRCEADETSASRSYGYTRLRAPVRSAETTCVTLSRLLANDIATGSVRAAVKSTPRARMAKRMVPELVVESNRRVTPLPVAPR